MNQAELAQLAGVSTSTVSRALAGHPSVAAATVERIRALARQHAVQPNALARGLRMKSTGSVGLILPLGHARDQHLTDPFFLSLLGLVADRLVERGYDILLSRVIPEDDRWLDRLIDSGRIDGLLIVGQSNQAETIERAADRYRPLVVWGALRPEHRQVTIGSDNVAGGRAAANRLIDSGRRRLLFVGDPAPPEFADRLDGFRRRAAQGGHAVEIVRCGMTPDAAHAALRDRFAAGSPPDGIFAASDVLAMSVLRAAAEAGLAVPDALSVIGYDDVTLAAQTNPPLTTVRQDLAAGAGLMVDRLFALMAGQDAASALVPTELIVRRSG